MRGPRFHGALMLSFATVAGAPTSAMSQARDAGQGLSDGMRDSWLTARAKIALFANPRVKGQRIDVETVNGTVMLRGTVDSAEVKAAAASVAEAINGVRGVKNDLRVAADGDRPASAISDENITGEVQTHFARDAQLRSVAVRTEGGVVILTGTVPNIAASARASERAHRVAGVRFVKNELTYDAPTRNRSGHTGQRSETGA